MNKRVLLVVTILVVGIAAAASFAVTATSASVTLGNIEGGSSSFMNVMTRTAFQAAGGDTKHGSDPSWTPVGDTAGGITTPGDLYYLESSTVITEAIAFVYLTNAGDLANCYSYLNMGLNLWWGDGTVYTETTGSGADDWLTLTNGYVSFTFPPTTTIDSTQVVTYAITLDEISWYCTDGTCNSDDLSPSFYVHVVQK